MFGIRFYFHGKTTLANMPKDAEITYIEVYPIGMFPENICLPRVLIFPVRKKN